MNRKFFIVIILVACVALFMNFAASPSSVKIGVLSSQSSDSGASFIQYNNTKHMIAAAKSGEIGAMVIDSLDYIAYYDMLNQFKIVYTIPQAYYFCAFSGANRTIGADRPLIVQYIFDQYPDESRSFQIITFDNMDGAYRALLDKSVGAALLNSAYAERAKEKGATLQNAFPHTGNPSVFIVSQDLIAQPDTFATLSEQVKNQFQTQTPVYSDFAELVVWLYSEEKIKKRYDNEELIYAIEK